jgi:hypothetical protein
VSSTALARVPRRYRQLPCGPQEREQYNRRRDELLARATELDAQQQALAVELADVRTALAELRVVLWPRVERKDFVRGFRYTRVKGPAPIPPEAPNARVLWGRDLRSVVLAILARNDRPMKLVEIHRDLHLSGFAMKSRFPVKRLADALGYEASNGRARRVERGAYALGTLNPSERRRADATCRRLSPPAMPRIWSDAES